MRINVELVRVEELVQNNSSGWKAMVRVVLVVLVAKLVTANTLTPKSIVFPFEFIKLPLHPLICSPLKCFLKSRP